MAMADGVGVIEQIRNDTREIRNDMKQMKEELNKLAKIITSRIMLVKKRNNLSDGPYDDDMLIEERAKKRLKSGESDNLSDLPSDILVDIAKRLKKLEDFTCFSSVSTWLRGAVKKDFFEGVRLRQGIPYLMLPPPVREDDDTRDFYSLIEGESIVASSVKIAKFKTRKCLESLGWLLVSDLDGSMSLVDPFLGTEISLPHQDTFPDYEEFEMDPYGFFYKMVLSSRPSESSDFVLIVIAGDMTQLGFWRPGDKAWNKIETRVRGGFSDVVYYGGGRFYAVSYPAIFWVLNVVSGTHIQIEASIVACFIHENVINLKQQQNVINLKQKLEIQLKQQLNEDGRFAIGFNNVLVGGGKGLYIVKTVDDSLLVVTRTTRDPIVGEHDLFFMTTKFHVYQVHLATGTFEEIYSLGNMAVFLGHNSTVALDASRFSGGGGGGGVIKANHIYFTDDNWEMYTQLPNGGGMDSGVYNMKTGTIEPIYPGEVLCSKVSPSTWITPCF